MGERIVSLRTLLHRACLSRSYAHNLTDVNRFSFTQTTFARLPLYRGFDPNGINSAEGILVSTQSFPFNCVHNTHINWIGACFIGSRGSIQWHINVAGPGVVANLTADRRKRTLSTTGYRDGFSITDTASADGVTFEICRRTTNELSGISVTNQNTQTGFSIEAPFYSRFKFDSCSPLTRTLGEKTLRQLMIVSEWFVNMHHQVEILTRILVIISITIIALQALISHSCFS